MKIIKKNIIGFIVGGIIFGGLNYTIASQILATQVSYTNTKSQKNVISVDGALTELYGLAEECQEANSSGSTIEYKGQNAVEIFLDPTNLTKTCTSADSSNTGINSGCMRFYVYAEDSKYKYAILDHNTTAKYSAESYCNSNCFATAQSQVKQDTSGWDPNLQARNISAMEVYKITESTNYLGINNINFDITGGSYFSFNNNPSNGRGYSWLFDRTSNCVGYGYTTADSNVNGYWTSDAWSSSSAWFVDHTGELTYTNFNLYGYGVRPVIKIVK